MMLEVQLKSHVPGGFFIVPTSSKKSHTHADVMELLSYGWYDRSIDRSMDRWMWFDNSLSIYGMTFDIV